MTLLHLSCTVKSCFNTVGCSLQLIKSQNELVDNDLIFYKVKYLTAVFVVVSVVTRQLIQPFSGLHTLQPIKGITGDMWFHVL